MNTQNSVERQSKLIAVTGPTGAGKTTFINTVCGSKLKVGTSLQSCTSKVEIAHCKFGNDNITLIDTPGFDDTYKSQAEILNDIADFLEQTYEKGRKLSGVIYMHRISDFRVGGIARENFRLFSKICGKDAMKNVRIVTTMWEDVPEEVGEQREIELASKPLFFKDAVDHGAQMCRFYNTPSSAVTTMTPFLSHLPEALRMQHEIVDERKQVPQTDAGTELKSELERQAQQHQQELQGLRSEMNDAMAERDAAHRDAMEEVRKAYEDLQVKLSKVEREMKKLREVKPAIKAKRGIRERLFGSLGYRGGRQVQNMRYIYLERTRGGSGCIDDEGFEM